MRTRLQKQARQDTMLLNMGPSHPAMHGTIRIMLELDGERILNSEVEVGYLHRGFEKTCEHRTYFSLLPYTDRLNYVSPLINNLGYVMTVEKLLGVEVRAAPPPGFDTALKKASEETRLVLKDVHGLLDKNKIFLNRTRDVAVMS